VGVNKGLISLGTLAVALAFVTSAQAQTAATPAATTPAPEAQAVADSVADIVVTAQFRATRLQDTPIAITAVNSALMEARGQTDISQVAAQAPNVTLRPQPQNGGTGLIAFIRGVGQTDFNYALDPGVGVYVDDVYIPTLTSSLLDLMDLDRVEILRGPQGTLAGKNSIGGAIKLFSAKPDGSGHGSLSVGYGSYNKIDARGTADFKVAENLFARVSAVAKSSKGYVDVVDYGLSHPSSNVLPTNTRGAYAKTGTQGGQSYVAGRVALRWVPTDRLEVNVSGDYTRDRSEAGPDILIAAGAVSATPAAFNPKSVNPATNANGGAWLVGKNGAPVPIDCRFVASGPYSCDTGLTGVNVKKGYVSYANFLDGMTPTSQAPYKPYAGQQNQDFTGWGVAGNITYKLTDTLQFVSITSYRQYQSNFGQDQDITPVPSAQLDNQLNHHAWSEEVRLNGSLFDKKLEYTLGGFYFDQNGRYTARVDLNYAGIDFLHGPDTTPSTSKALFANGAFHPTSAWTISGGLRYTKDEKTYTYYRRNPDGSIPFVTVPPSAAYPIPICQFFQGAPTAGPTGVGNSPNCLLAGLYGISDTFKGNRWDWRISSDYRISEALLVYGSVATGYKGGGVNPRPFFGPSAGSCTAPGYVAGAPCNELGSFKPETLTTYEAGFKSDFFDRKVRLNGAVFFNKYNDIILTLTACPAIPCLKPANVGRADVKGFELETTIRPVDGVTLDGSLSYIDFKYKTTGTSGIPLSATTPYTPKWTGSIGAQYDHAISPGLVSLRFDGSYQSSLFTDPSNSFWSKVDGYFLANGRLSFTTTNKAWRVALEVQNIFNKYYFLTKSDVTTSLGLVSGRPGLPRTWSLNIKRNF
jgi:iron complex outermembrane receptor protein